MEYKTWLYIALKQLLLIIEMLDLISLWGMSPRIVLHAHPDFVLVLLSKSKIYAEKQNRVQKHELHLTRLVT
jgi:hypothetical protein